MATQLSITESSQYITCQLERTLTRSLAPFKRFAAACISKWVPLSHRDSVLRPAALLLLHSKGHRSTSADPTETELMTGAAATAKPPELLLLRWRAASPSLLLRLVLDSCLSTVSCSGCWSRARINEALATVCSREQKIFLSGS